MTAVRRVQATRAYLAVAALIGAVVVFASSIDNGTGDSILRVD